MMSDEDNSPAPTCLRSAGSPCRLDVGRTVIVAKLMQNGVDGVRFTRAFRETSVGV